MRRLIALLPLAACASEAAPILTVGIDDQQQVFVSLRRDEDHVFIGLHATINGVDLGNATIERGLATFIESGVEGTDAHVVVTDDGAQYAMDMAGLLAPRQVAVERGDPLHAGDEIEISTGVATDALGASAYLKQGDDYCLLANDNHSHVGSAPVEIPSLVGWKCEPVQAGTAVDVTLEVVTDFVAPLTDCTPGVTCVQGGMPQVTLELPATLQF